MDETENRRCWRQGLKFCTNMAIRTLLNNRYRHHHHHHHHRHSVYVFMWRNDWKGMWVYAEVREQLARTGSLYRRFPGSNAGCQAGLQTLVTLESCLHMLSVENVTTPQTCGFSSHHLKSCKMWENSLNFQVSFPVTCWQAEVLIMNPDNFV